MTTTTQHESVQQLTANGWKIISETSAGIQLERPKQWNKLNVLITVAGMVGGLLISPLLFYVGGLFLILTVGDYLLKKPETKLLSPKQ